jgi:AcrR family transcriptional regulator
MLASTKRAGASEKPIYCWFGSKHGLFTAMLADNTRNTARLLRRAWHRTVH